jgi:CHASE2 domain-containing sensor protein
MPGAVVLINAIHSLLQYGQMDRPSVWLVLGIEFVLILGVSILFSIMGTYLAKIVSGVVVLVVLLPLTFSMFKYGLWLDFALPLLGVQLHELVARVKSSAMIDHS